MTGYKVFLTKSYEVARLLAEAHKVGKDGISKISFGMTDGDDRIPFIYQDCDCFYCIVEYGDSDRSMYEVVFA